MMDEVAMIQLVFRLMEMDEDVTTCVTGEEVVGLMDLLERDWRLNRR
jgi:hypothetical protein